MSRTDKDRPYWVRCNDNSEDRLEYHFHTDPWGNNVECDIDIPLTQEDTNNCRYHIFDTKGWVFIPNRRHRHTGWFNPVRMRSRDALKSLVDEYNTWGDFEEDYLDFGDHRNAPFKKMW